MEEDDIVVIDRADCDMKKIDENSVYAVRKDDLYYEKHLHYEEKNKTLQLISASPHFINNHGFEYIHLKEIEENPITGKVVFSVRRVNQAKADPPLFDSLILFLISCITSTTVTLWDGKILSHSCL